MTHQMNHAFLIVALCARQWPPFIDDVSAVYDAVGDDECCVSNHGVRGEGAFVVYLKNIKALKIQSRCK